MPLEVNVAIVRDENRNAIGIQCDGCGQNEAEWFCGKFPSKFIARQATINVNTNNDALYLNLPEEGAALKVPLAHEDAISLQKIFYESLILVAQLEIVWGARFRLALEQDPKGNYTLETIYQGNGLDSKVGETMKARDLSNQATIRRSKKHLPRKK